MRLFKFYHQYKNNYRGLSIDYSKASKDLIRVGWEILKDDEEDIIVGITFKIILLGLGINIYKKVGKKWKKKQFSLEKIPEIYGMQ